MTTNNAINTFPSNRNLIIAGDIGSNPWQRGTTFVSPVDNQYTADMYNWTTSGSGRVTISQVADGPTVAQAGIFSTQCISIAVTTADNSIISTTRYAKAYRMEGYDWSHIAQRQAIFSFWVKSTKTGIFCISLSNLGNDRSYLSEYTINASDTWEFKTIPISPSPSAGTWDYTNNTGLRIRWCLGAGSNFQGVVGWQTGNFLCTANQVNAMDSTSNIFKLDLIKIEPGITVTPYEIENEAETLLKCQRYYYKSYNVGSAPGATNSSGAMAGFTSTTSNALTAVMSRNKVNMRTTPTITWYSSSTGASGNVRNSTAAADEAVTSTSGVGESSAGYPSLTGSATASNLYIAQYVSDASLA